MTCESFDGRLEALLDGRCTPGEWAEAEEHLAECATCRRLFEAMSGRAGDLDADGHEALAAAVIAKTSGSGGACTSARERLCEYVDGVLEPFDRELIEGHLGRCPKCSALADAVAWQTRVLATFTDLAPRAGLVQQVLAATSRRPVSPGAAAKIGEWLARAAQRPRFSLEVAYVMTLVLLVVLGNPVAAFREASVRVQPRVSAVTVAVSRPLNDLRAAGAEKLSEVERALAANRAKPAAAAGAVVESSLMDALAGRAEALFGQVIVSPLHSIVTRVGEWASHVIDAVRRAFAAGATEPARPAGR